MNSIPRVPPERRICSSSSNKPGKMFDSCAGSLVAAMSCLKLIEHYMFLAPKTTSIVLRGSFRYIQSCTRSSF